MADDTDLDDSVPTDLPEPVRQWLADISAERGVTQEELLSGLLSAIHTDGAPQATNAVLPDDIDAELTDRLEETRSEFRALVEDVRERIIQVKRETDQKALEGHDHPSIDEDVDALDDALDGLEETVTELQTTVDQGFDNFEEILEYLTDTTDTLSSKITTLAAAVVEARDQFDELTEFYSEQAILIHLSDKANTNSVTKAKCSACGERVYLGLLRAPRCPHCSEVFHDLDVNHGLFGSSTLKTGSLPALHGETTEEDPVDLSHLTPDRDPDEPDHSR